MVHHKQTIKLSSFRYRFKFNIFNKISDPSSTKYLLIDDIGWCWSTSPQFSSWLISYESYVDGMCSWNNCELGKSEFGKFLLKITDRSWQVLNAVLSYPKLSNFGPNFLTS